MSKKLTDLWCVLFVSTGMKDTTPEELKDILDAVADQRRLRGITGLVLFAHGNNLIMIEGSMENVQQEYESAQQHPGHHSMIKLYSGPIPYRFFEEWPLALKVVGPEEFKKLDDFISNEQQEYFKEFLEIDHFVARSCRNFIRNNT
jgi:hypothetical protein